MCVCVCVCRCVRADTEHKPGFSRAFGKEMMLRMCSRSKLPMDLSKEDMRKMTFQMLLPLVMAGEVDPVSLIIIIVIIVLQ